jgi:flagellar FliJ protein
MAKWAQSLIRISGYEVETLQKRLAEISTRRASAEMRLAVLDAEVEIERERARDDAASAMLLPAYLEGWKIRRASATAELELVAREEEGARDALTRAFEEQKKFEHVAEMSRLAQLAAAAKREGAMLDDLALRQASRG